MIYVLRTELLIFFETLLDWQTLCLLRAHICASARKLDCVSLKEETLRRCLLSREKVEDVSGS